MGDVVQMVPTNVQLSGSSMHILFLDVLYVHTIFTNRPFTARRDPNTRLAPYVKPFSNYFHLKKYSMLQLLYAGTLPAYKSFRIEYQGTPSDGIVITGIPSAVFFK